MENCIAKFNALYKYYIPCSSYCKTAYSIITYSIVQYIITYDYVYNMY